MDRCVPWQKGSQGVTRAAVIGALVCIVFIEGLIFAAVPRGGFVDRFLRATEPTPQLISVPIPRPPTVAEKLAGKKS